MALVWGQYAPLWNHSVGVTLSLVWGQFGSNRCQYGSSCKALIDDAGYLISIGYTLGTSRATTLSTTTNDALKSVASWHESCKVTLVRRCETNEGFYAYNFRNYFFDMVINKLFGGDMLKYKLPRKLKKKVDKKFHKLGMVLGSLIHVEIGESCQDMLDEWYLLYKLKYGHEFVIDYIDEETETMGEIC